MDCRLCTNPRNLYEESPPVGKSSSAAPVLEALRDGKRTILRLTPNYSGKSGSFTGTRRLSPLCRRCSQTITLPTTYSISDVSKQTKPINKRQTRILGKKDMRIEPHTLSMHMLFPRPHANRQKPSKAHTPQTSLSTPQASNAILKPHHTNQPTSQAHNPNPRATSPNFLAPSSRILTLPGLGSAS